MFMIFIILIGSSFMQSYTPLFFKKILDKLEKQNDATAFIIIYCLAFRSGNILLKNLQELLFAPFSAFCECETGLMLF